MTDIKRILKTAWPLLLAGLWIAFAFFLPFDDDEFQHANFAWLIHGGHRPYVDFFEHHFPVWHTLTAPVYLLGTGPWVLFMLRLMNAGFGMATLYICFRIARKTGAGGNASAIAMILLAATPMFLVKMSEARPEPPAILLLVYALWRCIETDSNGNDAHPYDAFAAGLASGLAVVFSFKYIFVAAGICAAWLLCRSPRKTLRFIIGGLVAPVVMLTGMAITGILLPAIEATITMSINWQYRFSPAGYLVESFETAGLLLAVGTTGIVTMLNGATAATRKHGLALGLTATAAVAGILLVPVPHRQTFLPLFPPVAIAAAYLMQQCTNAFDDKRIAAIGGILLLTGGLYPAVNGITRALPHSPKTDVEQMRQVEKMAPGAVFDGRRLLFYRPHIGQHACMHDEILTMLDLDAYTKEVTNGLTEASFPPVIKDYRVQNMPPEILRFIETHYVPFDEHGLYMPGIRLDRGSLAGGNTEFSLPVTGVYRVNWRGDSIYVNNERLDRQQADGTVFLQRGTNTVRAAGFVDRIEFVLTEYKQ